MRNLYELSCNPSPYILPVIPRPLPIEIEEGEHYVIADLLNLAPGSSSPAQTSQTKVVGRELVISLRPEHPSLAREDSSPTPQASKEVGRGSRLERLPFTKKDSRSAPKHPRREDGCLSGEERLARGWKILSLGLPQYLAAPLQAKRKKRRTRWLTSFITSVHGSTNRVPASSGRLMLPPRWLVRLINTQPAEVFKGR